MKDTDPKMLVLLQFLISLITWSVVTVTVDINDFFFISLDTSRVSSFDVVNCLLKLLAICFGVDT